MVVCGPKASTVGLILSIWGILQLAVTGLLLHQRSVAFVQDLDLNDAAFNSPSELSTELDNKFQAGALNCWIAALMVTFMCPCAELIKFIYSEKATKFCEISNVDLSYVVPVKSTVEILQNFLAFSEYMNFMICNLFLQDKFLFASVTKPTKK